MQNAIVEFIKLRIMLDMLNVALEENIDAKADDLQKQVAKHLKMLYQKDRVASIASFSSKEFTSSKDDKKETEEVGKSIKINDILVKLESNGNLFCETKSFTIDNVRTIINILSDREILTWYGATRTDVKELIEIECAKAGKRAIFNENRAEPYLSKTMPNDPNDLLAWANNIQKIGKPVPFYDYRIITMAKFLYEVVGYSSDSIMQVWNGIDGLPDDGKYKAKMKSTILKFIA